MDLSIHFRIRWKLVFDWNLLCDAYFYYHRRNSWRFSAERLLLQRRNLVIATVGNRVENRLRIHAKTDAGVLRDNFGYNRIS